VTWLAIGERSKHKQSDWPPNKTRDWQKWKNMAVLWRRRSKHMIIDKRMHRKGEREREPASDADVCQACALYVSTLSRWQVRDTLWLWYLCCILPSLSPLLSPHLKLWVKYLTSSNLFSSYFSSYVMHLAETLGDAPAASESYSESWFNSIREVLPQASRKSI